MKISKDESQKPALIRFTDPDSKKTVLKGLSELDDRSKPAEAKAREILAAVNRELGNEFEVADAADKNDPIAKLAAEEAEQRKKKAKRAPPESSEPDPANDEPRGLESGKSESDRGGPDPWSSEGTLKGGSNSTASAPKPNQTAGADSAANTNEAKPDLAEHERPPPAASSSLSSSTSTSDPSPSEDAPTPSSGEGSPTNPWE
ncbi:MAG: hypothetical protein ACREH5_03455, partial [Candidatus Omnitrophota bacterium]